MVLRRGRVRLLNSDGDERELGQDIGQLTVRRASFVCAKRGTDRRHVLPGPYVLIPEFYPSRYLSSFFW
jgi:hypothetical protein